jgi:hypothetical protein
VIEPAGPSSGASDGHNRAWWFVRTLTTVHAVGALVLVGMTLYVLARPDHARQFARSPGAKLMVNVLGPWLPMFLGGLALFLGSLAWASFRRRPWAWRAAIVAYSIGVIGSLWEVAIGIQQAWVSALINAGVVAMLLSRPTRRAYFARPST